MGMISSHVERKGETGREVKGLDLVLLASCTNTFI